jgi:NAD(P)-dependent dehydrogenase (short-subunit alcohol dehydrogenase family)
MSAYSATKSAVEAMCNALRVEVAHLGVDVATIHPTWLDTDMVREAEAAGAFLAYKRLREAMRPPFKRTHPVDRAVKDIASGFAKRRRRICTPPIMQLAHAARPALTTRAFERDWRAAAPEISRLFEAEIAERGLAGASVSDRVGRQMVR